MKSTAVSCGSLILGPGMDSLNADRGLKIRGAPVHGNIRKAADYWFPDSVGDQPKSRGSFLTETGILLEIKFNISKEDTTNYECTLCCLIPWNSLFLIDWFFRYF